MSGARPYAHIHGVAVSAGWRDASLSLTDLIFRTVSSAMADAGAPMSAADSIVLAAHDLVDGRSLSSMVTAPAAGGCLRDEVRLAEDGLAAASLGAARIEAGESEMTVVAAWGRASEGDFARTSKAAFDPFMVQPFALDEFGVSALRMSAWIGRHGLQAEARRLAAQSRAGRAARNPRAIRDATGSPALNFPLTAAEAPAFADLVVAVVLARAPARVRIAGCGHSTEVHSPGDRDLLEMRSLREAVGRAVPDGLAKAGIDVFELSGATLADEAIAMEALGVVPPGGGFGALAELAFVNPSGGGASGWCFPANGLARLAECHLQLTGAAGAVQLGAVARSALATGVSPIGGQTSHAVLLEAA